MSFLKPKPILNRNELKQIKQSRTKLEGKKIITDDVRKLKSLKVTPELAPDEQIKYYKEPIWIEYYIPKESRFALETKYLYILLINVIPRETDFILKEAIEKDTFIDLLKLIEEKKDYSKLIKTSYKYHLGMLETISYNITQFLENKDPEFLKSPIYLTEVIMMYEPTLATLEVLGDYALYNLQWLIRKMNTIQYSFSLEDRTIALLIKRRNQYFEEKKLPEDEEFELLSALFFEQAYPHRGADALSEQDFLIT